MPDRMRAVQEYGLTKGVTLNQYASQNLTNITYDYNNNMRQWTW